MREVVKDGKTVTVRTSRIQQVRDFIESGATETEIPVAECEYIGTVTSALHNAIVNSPYFFRRCAVIQRRRRVYLVRR